MEEICKNGGNVAILDMSEEAGQEFAKEIGSSAKFFVCNVLETDSISKAVKGAAEWIQQTGKPLGGVIPAAGVSTPATVSLNSLHCKASPQNPYETARGLPLKVYSCRPNEIKKTKENLPPDPQSRWRSIQPR